MLMGIVNVTPDSFSDGGQFLDSAAAVARGAEMAAQGADIIDVGGESTRPGARPVSEAEELRRGLPRIQRPAGPGEGASFIHTREPPGGRGALPAGAPPWGA